jgi:hypothetical protein
MEPSTAADGPGNSGPGQSIPYGRKDGRLIRTARRSLHPNPQVGHSSHQGLISARDSGTRSDCVNSELVELSTPSHAALLCVCGVGARRLVDIALLVRPTRSNAADIPTTVQPTTIQGSFPAAAKKPGRAGVLTGGKG